MHQGERQDQKGPGRDVGEIGFQAMVRLFIFYKYCRDPSLFQGKSNAQGSMNYEPVSSTQEKLCG